MARLLSQIDQRLFGPAVSDFVGEGATDGLGEFGREGRACSQIAPSRGVSSSCPNGRSKIQRLHCGWADIISSSASAIFGLPYFACGVVVLGNGIVANNLTWAEARMPQQALVVLKERSSAWTDDLMEAISTSNELN